MSKYCVKKPYTVVVAVVMVIVLGVISFMNMVTDLLPAMELPYVVVVTTMPGASPEQVESRITAPLEAGLGTVNGVTNVTSTSSENVSTVVLEFDGGTNMDSAMVNLSTAVDQVRGALPDTAGNPMLLQISPDMLPVMIAAVDMEGMDIYQLTDFASETVIPAFERQPGVASVSGTGLVEKSVEIRLSEEKIEAINTKVLASVDEELADAKAELDDAKKKVDDGRAELESGKTALENQQGDTAAELADASAQLDSAIAQAQALASQQTALEASKAALEAEKKGLEQAKGMQAELQKAAAGIVFSATTDMGGGALVPAPTDPEELARWEAAKAVPAVFIKEYISDEVWTTLWSAMAGSMPDALKTMSRTQFLTALDPDARIAEIDVALADLSTELMAAQVMAEQAKAGVEKAKEAYKKLEEGKILAAAGFGSASAQLAAAESALKEGEAQLEDAQKQFEDARKAALEQADVSQLLTKDLVSSLVMAQNFAMPAGYLYQGEDQYLLKVGDAFSSVEEVENALLLHMDAGDVGDVRLSDVADVTVIDNSGESYARMNGNPAVAVSIQKASTASTSEVSKTVNEAIEELEAKYPGLRITPLMDQGVYIQMTVDSVLSNLGWGAVLAVLVLALFLKDLRPTLVVAFSIPISLMFAVVLMYFSGVTLNMISLSGLALGVGMLVDNSIVVVENIYRLRSQGVPAAKAAVRGTRQVSGAIAASTLTTVCVFLPIVFTDGLTRQLFVDMGLTIAYSLLASLIVALTLVPTLSATMLRESKEKRHPWFDKMLAVYERALDFCLRVKVVPLALAAALLALCVWHTTQMGMEFIPNMSANQISATLTLPEDTKRADAYALTDEAMALMQQVEGVETVGAMDGGTGMSMMGMGGAGGSDTVESMSFYLVLDENADSEKTADDLTALSAQLPGCEVSVTTSSMDLSVLGGSGVELIVRGPDVDELNRITHDLMDILRGVEGLEEPTNGQEEGTPQLRLVVDKDAAMRCGLTAAQIYSELAAALTTETTSTTLTVGAEDYEVVVADERNKLDRDTLMQYEFEVTGTGPDAETETHTLSEFASLKDDFSLASVARENQQRYMTVTAAVKEGYNATLISRDIQPTLDSYDLPDGYTLEVGGETQTVADAMQDLVLMILLAVVFIYMIMVAQFQSLLGPFIVMLTMPLAFTGGLGALWIAGLPLSVISMLGFLILAGVVVNNGIVFVDYANQLRLEGMEKRAALIETGKTRMRPILMTALTTILAMSTMAFSTGMGAELSKPMALVTMGGLGYATLLTLFIVPVFYDLLFRKPLKKIDVDDAD
ncbi:MAG TPA: efflux RND transporter permease subunit [Candidatus Fournierella pullicola]|uniref:Efflux RND transporter permease subunit n=1 Tax=Candidatus Allofournierella pullicola TaxID=2838596 RepID=A0A9D1V5L0_9FIRM|nr:efflux RND transporter permease subunit [Candidatus Fournierella pullicola]